MLGEMAGTGNILGMVWKSSAIETFCNEGDLMRTFNNGGYGT